MVGKKYTTAQQIEEMRREIRAEKQKLAQRQTSGRYRLGTMLRSAVKMLGWGIFIAVVLFLVAAIISVNIAKSSGEIPSVAGFQLFHVETGSMEPTLPIGTVIVSRIPKDPNSLARDTIVTFRTTAGAVVTHRITAVVADNGTIRYQTKGDNPRNAVDPELLEPERIVGVFIMKIPLS